MLRELSIKNFAIIDDLNIRFNDGLTILSGETGAGKSIIINAVNLLLGSRVSATMIRDGCDTAELSAFFDIPEASAASSTMSENGYDPKEGLLVRRVIAGNNRHRIYINDRMATMQMLASITADLASISGQHAHQGLLKEETHLAILDRYGGLLPLGRQLAYLYEKMLPLSQILQELKEKKVDQKKEMDLLRYQAAEIADADIAPDEDKVLETKRSRLKNTETLHQSVFSAIQTLYGVDGSILEQLGEVRKTLGKTVDLDARLGSSIQGLTDSFFGLEEVTEALRSYLSALDTDDNQLDAVESRLDLINKLKRKYGGSLDSLFEKRDAIENELTAFINVDEEIHRCEDRLNSHHDQAVKLSRRLSDRRKQIARMLSTSVEKELAGLRMTGTCFSINFSIVSWDEKTSPWFCVDGALLTKTGIDQAVFVISPNVGESLKPLSAIASGGELSRVVLAIKAILAETDSVATVIFDEVDAGIGGAVAEVVGKKLEVLSQKHQLICITHHPQIARFGDHHYYIEKQVKIGRTTAAIRPMDQEERVIEIARMLDGEKITQTALEHARALLAS